MNIEPLKTLFDLVRVHVCVSVFELTIVKCKHDVRHYKHTSNVLENVHTNKITSKQMTAHAHTFRAQTLPLRVVNKKTVSYLL